VTTGPTVVGASVGTAVLRRVGTAVAGRVCVGTTTGVVINGALVV